MTPTKLFAFMRRGVHPKLRAPRFDESAFPVAQGDGIQTLDVKVAP